ALGTARGDARGDQPLLRIPRHTQRSEARAITRRNDDERVRRTRSLSFVAERVRFELTVRYQRTPAFEAGAFNHSTTSPSAASPRRTRGAVRRFLPPVPPRSRRRDGSRRPTAVYRGPPLSPLPSDRRSRTPGVRCAPLQSRRRTSHTALSSRTASRRCATGRAPRLRRE